MNALCSGNMMVMLTLSADITMYSLFTSVFVIMFHFDFFRLPLNRFKYFLVKIFQKKWQVLNKYSYASAI
jgi:hypothetical protein